MRVTIRVALVASLSVLALSAGGAHAATASISITTPDDSLLLNSPTSLPLPDGSPVIQSIDGTVDGASLVTVSLQNTDTGSFSGGIADITCSSAGACEWTYTPVFAVTPGDYDVTATAAADDGTALATAAVHIQIV